MDGDARQLRIVILDDDKQLLGNLGVYLRNRGWEVSCCDDCAQARAALSARLWDVLLVDYRLGAESGLDFIRDIRAKYPALPVVFTSAYLDEWIESMAQCHRPIRCLRKPFTGASLLSEIASAVGSCSAPSR